MAAKIDKEVKSIIDKQYQVALNILKENRAIMDKMVKALYEKETIYEAEIDALFETGEVPATDTAATDTATDAKAEDKKDSALPAADNAAEVKAADVPAKAKPAKAEKSASSDDKKSEDDK